MQSGADPAGAGRPLVAPSLPAGPVGQVTIDRRPVGSIVLATVAALPAGDWESWVPDGLDEPSPRGSWRRLHTVLGWLVTAVAVAVLWIALVLPDRLYQVRPGALLRLPIEALALVAIAIVLPTWPRRIVSGLFGLAVGVLVLAKLLNMGFYEALDRPFNPIIDWSSLGPALGVLRDSIGRPSAGAVVVVAVSALGALVVLVMLSTMRVASVVAARRPVARRGLLAGAAAWALFAVAGIQPVAGLSLASSSAVSLAFGEVQAVRAAVVDRGVFSKMLAAPDPRAAVPTSDLLAGLRGKDVVLAFVESYGQVAVEGTTFSPAVDAVLRQGTTALRSSGFESRSAFLSSPTFGGISWLAHSTLQSGLWIDTQQRYDQLVASQHFTLSDAFRRAGWRTVSDIPSDGGDWPQGRTFYHYGTELDAGNVGYRGPRFSYARIPDQYTLSAFTHLELQPHHRPVMAEIDLVSSHTPWTPLPRLVPWSTIGNGSGYRHLSTRGGTPTEVWQHASQVQAMYGQSIQYSMRSLVSFVQHAQDPNLVVVLLGDHQPATIVSGNDANHDVPISIVSHDPSVLQRIASWGWDAGLLPDPQAPVWPMDAFRNRFLTAFDAQTPARPKP